MGDVDTPKCLDGERPPHGGFPDPGEQEPGALLDVTAKEAIDRAILEIKRLRDHAGDGDEAREYSIAITALEDAKMRTTRGLAKGLGVFNEVDLQRPAGVERAQENHAANVAGNAEGGISRS